jgi:hypothetical protein
MMASASSIIFCPAKWTAVTVATHGSTNISHRTVRCQGAGRRLSVAQSAAKRAINSLVSAVSVPEVVDCTIEDLVDSTPAT